MTTADKVARLQALRAELLAITTTTERPLYGDLCRNLADLLHDLRLDAEREALP
jgi:hypothetical protein